MPRQPRLILPGVAVHITQRGNNRSDCFRRDGDYMLYLLHLRELADGLGCEVHAYCLMTNHVHMLLTPPSPDTCTVLMRNLGQRYVQHFNRTHERTGTLWEGRYRSFLVESARYALACYRYIEQNPLRAKLVREPADYPWSSHRANAGLGKDPLVRPHAEYLALSEDPVNRMQAYRSLFDNWLDAAELKKIREAAHSGLPLGSEAFKARMEIDLGRKLRHGKPGRPKSGSDPDLMSETKSGSDPDFQMPR
jgi:putative transposase